MGLSCVQQHPGISFSFFVVCDLFFLRMTGAATDELEQPPRSAATGAETSSQRSVLFEDV